MTFDHSTSQACVTSTADGSGVAERDSDGTIAPDLLVANVPGPRCDDGALLCAGGLELELLLLDCELFELDFRTCIALLWVWTGSGVVDDI